MSITSSILQVKGIKKSYSGSKNMVNMLPGVLALENINFSIDAKDKGLVTTILAPYGAGKSSLLKIIAALDSADEGNILLNGNEYSKPSGSIVYIPERPASFPWYNVRENISFALRDYKNEEDALKNITALVGLSGYEEHFPDNKSAGFRFRVSLARGLAMNPALVLLDDCFTSMNAETKSEVYSLIKDISSNLNINFLLATSDIHEAVLLSDVILLMKKDPGYIFKELINRDGQNSDSIIKMRNEIEELFRAYGGVGQIKYSM